MSEQQAFRGHDWRVAWTVLLAVAMFLGCGSKLGEPVTLVDGKVTISPPPGWTRIEKKDDGTVVVWDGTGRLSVALLASPPPAPDPVALIDTLRAMSPGLTVVKEADFDGGRAKEFIVSYRPGGSAGDGVVYLFPVGGHLCVLTFVIGSGDMEEWLSVFRDSAGTLKVMGGSS